jgi:hypothetical protein
VLHDGETEISVNRSSLLLKVPGSTPTSYLVALGTEGVVRVTGTWFTASAAGQLPVEGSTLVTFGAHYIGQTQAAPTLLITGHIPPGPQDTAVTACGREGCWAQTDTPQKAQPQKTHV